MGGYGSGQTGGRLAVEDCISISTANLLKYGYLAKPGSITWQNALGNGLYCLSVKAETSGDFGWITFRETQQTIELESTPLHFGGARWWFHCPDCARRCATLHKPPGRQHFACRLCLNLTYRSCLESGGGACGFSASTLRQVTHSRRPKWVRKRDRRPDYKPRGSWLEQLKREAGILL